MGEFRFYTLVLVLFTSAFECQRAARVRIPLRLTSKLQVFFAQAFVSDSKQRPQSAAEFFSTMEQAFWI
jgi:hypothetical protein